MYCQSEVIRKTVDLNSFIIVMRLVVPVRSNMHNVMLFVPENAILLMSPLKLIVAAAVLRKSVTSIVASL